MGYTYNENEYDNVKVRKKLFYKDHPDGRIIVEPLSDHILEYAYFKASIYINIEDFKINAPKATGFALELRNMELSISSSGKKYASVNYTSWTENTEESAIGRALDNMGYAGNDKCSRQEMEKADRMSKIEPSQPVNKYSEESTICKKCGVSIIWHKSKNDKPYARDAEGGEFHNKTCVKSETAVEKGQILAAIGEVMKPFTEEEKEICREEIRHAQTQGDLEEIHKHYRDLLEMRNQPEEQGEIF